MGKFLLVTSVRSKINANFRVESLVLLPASILGTVYDGGFVSIVMMSSSSCIRKASNFTTGKYIFWGKDHSIDIHFCSCGENVTFYATIMIEVFPYIPSFLSIRVLVILVSWFGNIDCLCSWCIKGGSIEIKLFIEKSMCG